MFLRISAIGPVPEGVDADYHLSEGDVRLDDTSFTIGSPGLHKCTEDRPIQEGSVNLLRRRTMSRGGRSSIPSSNRKFTEVVLPFQESNAIWHVGPQLHNWCSYSRGRRLPGEETLEMAEFSAFALNVGIRKEIEVHLEAVGHSLDFQTGRVRNVMDREQCRRAKTEMGERLSVCMWQ